MPDTQDGKVTLALLGQQQDNILVVLHEVSDNVRALKDNDHQRELDIRELQHCMGDMPEIKQKVEFMHPWVRGIRWFALIAGGIIAFAIVVGLLWAVAQSGSLIP